MSAHADSGTGRVAVVVMAKCPEPGQVKTRLGQDLGAADAAALYAEMLADRCEQIASLPEVIPAIAYANGAQSHAAPAGFRVVPQHEGGLGVGLKTAAEHFLEQGVAVVLIDSDSVTLPMNYVQAAVDTLRGRGDRHADVVLGPSEDGGYYLLGLLRPAPELFDDVPWSTARVAEVTLRRARGLHLDVHVLPTWWDVDTPADLERLRHDLLHMWWPRRTSTWLRAHELARVSAGTRNAASDGNGSGCGAEVWAQEASRVVYATPWLSVREDRVRLPTGQLTHYSVVDCGECVGVLPLCDDDTVLLVRQFRYPAGQVTWEMPTGGVNRHESPVEAARRELAEEAQVSARELEYLGKYHTSKSVMNETAHLFVARGIEAHSAHGDDTDFIDVEALPFARVVDMVKTGEIVDSMTIVAVLRAALARADASRGSTGTGEGV